MRKLREAVISKTRWRPLRTVVFPLLVLLALGLGSFAAARAAIGTGGAQDGSGLGVAEASTAQISDEELQKFIEEMRRREAEDRAKERFEGHLGDFFVSRSSRNSYPCSEIRGLPHSETPRSSELNLPGTTEQVICLDGSVVAASGPDGERSYFTDRAVAVLSAPLDRIELLELDGMPVLFVRGEPELMPSTIFVIQRRPNASEPGILLVFQSRGNRNAALDHARELVRQ